MAGFKDVVFRQMVVESRANIRIGRAIEWLTVKPDTRRFVLHIDVIEVYLVRVIVDQRHTGVVRASKAERRVLTAICDVFSACRVRKLERR